MRGIGTTDLTIKFNPFVLTTIIIGSTHKFSYWNENIIDNHFLLKCVILRTFFDRFEFLKNHSVKMIISLLDQSL
ncbi:hypothetical protein BpHYR1_030611 [Brachionus plicatilis]|uniref:Uncharacterized protein n=1 Tax=Brachionus plicatilis TaxID=10195 RepID=A0A3M7Q3A3_BRAPC|nr:hypothetical protein BpHYR1_030611 [Brachionus plicatilis]